jgi:hypothetical protein
VVVESIANGDRRPNYPEGGDIFDKLSENLRSGPLLSTVSHELIPNEEEEVF